MTEYQSIFKNDQAEAAYMAAYDRALEKWPVPFWFRKDLSVVDRAISDSD